MTRFYFYKAQFLKFGIKITTKKLKTFFKNKRHR